MFKNNIEPQPEPIDAEKIWNFDAPAYDHRSSSFIHVGCDKGVGKRQPVGSEKVTGKSSVPFGCYSFEAD